MPVQECTAAACGRRYKVKTLNVSAAARALSLLNAYHCSVLMANLAGRRYVFCGLGDGHLINYRYVNCFAVSSCSAAWTTVLYAIFSLLCRLEGTELVDRKRLALGTKPIRLRTFR